MNFIKFSFLCFFVFGIASCSVTKDTVYEASIPDFKEEVLDTMVVSAPRVGSDKDYELPVYRASYTREHDLIHTKLNLRFDWEKQQVLGLATLTLSPLFYDSDVLRLDAKGFDFHKIQLKNGRDLIYDYSGNEVFIQLDKKYSRDQEYTLIIDYTANPNRGPEGGSAAITSDKGLFFINPRKTNPNKPQQIWTQGETENNSKWFPTIDKPNERCTQEIYITIEDRFKTLSNGILVSSTKNNDGSRTDYWKQDKPHAPYLFMLAIGEYAIVNDQWKSKKVDYYVEPKYRDDAKTIFNHTPEMLSFFSEKLNYEYPWDKYSSVVCRDYVSGAMENTTAVIFGQFVQKTSRELIDNENDLIVAHEMFHHWFGDLVTCESWSNLTLNEGFANYSEYLWFEHKYGKDRAEHHRRNELNAYLFSSQNQGVHPLIHFEYDDKEEMFDAHSYNKGGLVLHMLRKDVGDDAFFASLNKYLVDNAYSAVEADELRMAFEDVTGRDLNWFFNQWYFDSGHPILNVDYNYIDSLKSLQVTVEQIQDEDNGPAVFILPFSLASYNAQGEVSMVDLVLNKRKQEFLIETTRPSFNVFDGNSALLAIINETKSEDEWIAQYRLSSNYLDRINALENIRSNESNAFDLALEDPYYQMRSKGLSNVDFSKNPSLYTKVEMMSKKDPHSRVRAKALEKLAKFDSQKAGILAEKLIETEQAYPVIGSALKVINMENPSRACELAESYSKKNIGSLNNTITEIFVNSGDPKYIEFVENKLIDGSLFEIFPIINKYYKMVSEQEPKIALESIGRIQAISLNPDEDNMKKFVITKNIAKLKNDFSSRALENPEFESYSLDLNNILLNIIDNEADDSLKSRYNSL